MEQWQITINLTFYGQYTGYIVRDSFQVPAQPNDSVDTFLANVKRVAQETTGQYRNKFKVEDLQPFNPTKLKEKTPEQEKATGPNCSWDPSKSTIQEAGLVDGAVLAAYILGCLIEKREKKEQKGLW